MSTGITSIQVEPDIADAYNSELCFSGGQEKDTAPNGAQAARTVNTTRRVSYRSHGHHQRPGTIARPHDRDSGVDTRPKTSEHEAPCGDRSISVI